MSPTIVRFRGLRAVIYPRDHVPPHIHVIGADGEVKFDLFSWEVLESYGYSDKSIRKMRDLLRPRTKELIKAWKEIHEKQ